MSISQTIQSVWAIFSSLVLLISGIINGGDITFSPNAQLIRTEQFAFDEALLMSQGITTDGEYFYTAGSIAALDLVGMARMQTVLRKLFSSIFIRKIKISDSRKSVAQ